MLNTNKDVGCVPVMYYFIFTEIKVAVAIRPGDWLVFNPRTKHCCSKKTSFYKNIRASLCSFYLKSSAVGGNNNLNELESEETSVLFVGATV